MSTKREMLMHHEISTTRADGPPDGSRNLPDWLVYPDTKWEMADPAEAGLAPQAFNEWVKSKRYTIGGYGGENPGGYGAVLTRGGKIVATWGDPALCASGLGAMLHLTFAGLDPSKVYECIVFASRGGTRYGHWKEDAFVKIEGADSFRNESSSGTGYDGGDDPSSLVMNGHNTIKGCMVRFTHIRPGSGGEFSLRQIESNADVKSIYANAVMLRECIS